MHRTIDRLRAEFLEMPGLRLTAPQVQRLCGVERTMCTAALNALVDAKFLHMSADGTYARLTEGQIPHPRPVNAEHDESDGRHWRRTA
jgi:hypothetical protein